MDLHVLFGQIYENLHIHDPSSPPPTPFTVTTSTSTTTSEIAPSSENTPPETIEPSSSSTPKIDTHYVDQQPNNTTQSHSHVRKWTRAHTPDLILGDPSSGHCTRSTIEN
ncbi:unnamed protein product [Cuscuta europaea]|uniref:Uncharacterized protein n=1 Tax=Cuscuta europaea TaxID=41803 RepID=A0A9P0YJJ3_CUSEU|nr:unnamed protein product [Cuscuta europaea]